MQWTECRLILISSSHHVTHLLPKPQTFGQWETWVKLAIQVWGHRSWRNISTAVKRPNRWAFGHGRYFDYCDPFEGRDSGTDGNINWSRQYRLPIHKPILLNPENSVPYSFSVTDTGRACFGYLARSMQYHGIYYIQLTAAPSSSTFTYICFCLFLCIEVNNNKLGLAVHIYSTKLPHTITQHYTRHFICILYSAPVSIHACHTCVWTSLYG